MIEFFDDHGVIGTVKLTDDNDLDASAVVQSLADSWLLKNRPPQDFETFYDGWSNGYMHARRVQEVDDDD